MSEKTKEIKEVEVPDMRVHIDSLFEREDSSLKAFASLYIGNSFAIHGLRVIEGEKGMFVAMPSKSYEVNGETKYADVAHAVSKEAYKALVDTTLKEYEEALILSEGEVEVMDEEIELAM